ncbi:dtw domain-containing protein 2 [Limosa lapponica baueri]|uniref:Dtw domain-containing protein 2 n=1 Tax=Limosa lapponica baueri TaxID=1758121 RepID=A0A2I0UTK0_LIMLA|nr:dtw domain-containing protein 2 [Limosa lapponica baueri]
MIGWGDEERMLPSMSMNSWSAWSSTWGWMKSRRRAYGSRLKGTGASDITVGVCYRPPDQDSRADEALYRQIGGAASRSHTLVLIGEFSHPNIYWKDNTAEHKKSRKFLECVDDNFLLQRIEEPMRRRAMLDLVLNSKDELVGNVKLRGSLG